MFNGLVVPLHQKVVGRTWAVWGLFESKILQLFGCPCPRAGGQRAAAHPWTRTGLPPKKVQDDSGVRYDEPDKGPQTSSKPHLRLPIYSQNNYIVLSFWPFEKELWSIQVQDLRRGYHVGPRAQTDANPKIRRVLRFM